MGSGASAVKACPTPAGAISANEDAAFTLPADDIEDHDEVVVLEVGHVRSQQVSLHFQLDVLREIRRRTRVTRGEGLSVDVNERGKEGGRRERKMTSRGMKL